MGRSAKQAAHLPSGDPWTLGDRLAKARKAAILNPHSQDGPGELVKLSQKELGIRCGFSQPTVVKYETGNHEVAADVLRRAVAAWALATGYSFEWLMHGTGPWYAGGPAPEPDTASDLPDRNLRYNTAGAIVPASITQLRPTG